MSKPLMATIALFAGGLLMCSPAVAGECPAAQVKADATKPGPAEPKDVTDNVISSIDLQRWMTNLTGYKLRMRRLVVQPGGIVPWHSHAERPANILIVSGEITEYRSNCAVPIMHKAGDAVPEFGTEVSHWWKNEGREPVVIISADLFNNKMKGDAPM